MATNPKPEAAVGMAIRRLRDREGLTQEDLAFRAGVHPTWISQVERGQQSTGWSTIKRIAEALGGTMVEVAHLAERIELE